MTVKEKTCGHYQERPIVSDTWLDPIQLMPVPYHTFNGALARFSPSLFRTVLQHLLSILPVKHLPEFATLGTLYAPMSVLH